MLKTARALRILNAVTAATTVALVDVFGRPAHAIDTTDLAGTAGGAFSQGYHAAPALMLGLVLAIVLSLLAFVALANRPIAVSAEATRRLRTEPEDGRNVETLDQFDAVPMQPFVEIEGAGRGRCTILRDMLRIGREDDNDIRIPSNAVQRYHAAIHREDYDDWHITSLSAGTGGLIVNGKRCSQARLHDGDVIQLGPGRLRFRAGYA